MYRGLSLALLLLFPADAHAMPAVCDRAAATAAHDSGVPERLLLAITRVETGRGTPVEPWPWTINSDGTGHWFATRQDAIDFARAEIAAGRNALDIGCFQMNLRWHADRFASLETMFDPQENARQAAGFLAELRAAKGNWTAATAAYHSQDSALARAYLLRVAETLGTAPSPAGPTPPRPNGFPLLTAGTTAPRGSLVPLLPGRGRLIGAD